MIECAGLIKSDDVYLQLLNFIFKFLPELGKVTNRNAIPTRPSL
jgi:hypothetical protein